MNLLYLVGPPASGKSTTMALLTAGCQRVNQMSPFTHDLLVDPQTGTVLGVELGRQRPAFPGTDAMALNVAPAARAWLALPGAPALLLAEGDRLAHAAFLDAAAVAGYAVTVGYLDTPDDVTDRRCAARGSAQNERWRRGRATRARRFAGHAAQVHTLVKLDGTAPTALNVAKLCAEMPALLTLPGNAP